MKSYYDFKNRKELEGTRFKLCVTKPNNLKPSLIRWQYRNTLESLGIIKSEEYDKRWKSDPTKSNKAFTLSL
jgi:hypothetical protein|nr:MAG TPA: hypothetical protein [Bacteriophage sp.]